MTENQKTALLLVVCTLIVLVVAAFLVSSRGGGGNDPDEINIDALAAYPELQAGFEGIADMHRDFEDLNPNMDTGLIVTGVDDRGDGTYCVHIERIDSWHVELVNGDVMLLGNC